MMKKLILFITIIANALLNLVADPITTEVASVVAKNFMNLRRSSPLNEIKTIETELLENESALYVVNFAGGGWVIVSANNSTIPVIGYSLEGTYSVTDTKPEAFAEWLNVYKDQVAQVSQLKTMSVAISQKWQALLTSSQIQTYTPGKILLNVSGRGEVKWSQDKNNSGGCTPSYNKYCPDSDGDKCDCDHKPAGCGAVAMGQIMWYWQWPRSYNWSIFPTGLYNSTPIEQGDAVATLLSDCGKASDMVYWCVGSWTTVNDIEDAFRNSFQYKGAEKRVRSNWPDDVWKHMIRNEIDCERPVFYRGDKSDLSGEKHFFVCDGYDTRDHNLFHINWGWGGNSNGFFSFDDMTPGNSNFNKNQMAIVGISPTCDIPADITDVNYLTIIGTKVESARNSIVLPASGKSLVVQSGANYTLRAGNTVRLWPGFTVNANGSFRAFTAPSGCNNDCGMEVSMVENVIIKGRDDTYGKFEIRMVNANSYDIVIMDRSGRIIYQGAGLLQSNVTTSIWDGSGADYQDVYYAIITFRNNCGERISKNQDITVLMVSSNSLAADTVENMKYSNPLLHVNGNQPTYNFIVFPNPNKGSFSIKADSKMLPYSVTIFNAIGQMLYKKDNINSGNYPIVLSDVNAGYLTVEIGANDRRYYFKVLVE